MMMMTMTMITMMMLLLMMMMLMILMLNLSPGDSLSYHNNAPFSTRDKDNDQSSMNCAYTYDGAWWYKECYLSNLNGKYTTSHFNSHPWLYWQSRPMTFSQMKMRPM